MSGLYPPAYESSATPIVQGVPVQVASGVTDSPAANSLEAAGKLSNFPPGLVKAMVSSLTAFPVRFFVVDNSGSMQATDGNRLILDAQGRGRMVQATRWEELSDTVLQIGAMAHALHARLDFTFSTRGLSSTGAAGWSQRASSSSWCTTGTAQGPRLSRAVGSRLTCRGCGR